MVVVGCKSDLEDKRNISTQEAKILTEQLIFSKNQENCKIPFFLESSSKDGSNVKECFESVVRMVIQKRLSEILNSKEELPIEKKKFVLFKSSSSNKDGNNEISEMKEKIGE
jgi:GTPase SAR1 family protein